MERIQGVVYCPHCGGQVQSGDAYCDNCGSQLPDIPKAMVGGSDDRFPHFTAGEAMPVRETGMVQPSSKGGAWKPLILITATVLVAMAFLGGGYLFIKENSSLFGLNTALNNESNKDSGSIPTNESSNATNSIPKLTNEGLIAAPDANHKMGFMDSYGKMIVPGTYENADDFCEGYAPVKMNGKWGLIDKNHNLVLDYVADGLGTVSEGMVPIYLNKSWGYLDLKDIKNKKYIRLVIPAEYDTVSEFSSGYVVVTKGDRAFFLDRLGNKAFPNLIEMERAWPFSEGVAAVRLAKPVVAEEPLALIDLNGKVIRTFPGYGAGKFVEGLMPVHRDEGTVYVDRNFKQILGPYDFGYEFLDGLAGVTQNFIFGFIDKTGKVVIPRKYDGTHYTIRHGVICISLLGRKYTYLDMDGNVIREGLLENP